MKIHRLITGNKGPNLFGFMYSHSLTSGYPVLGRNKSKHCRHWFIDDRLQRFTDLEVAWLPRRLSKLLDIVNPATLYLAPTGTDRVGRQSVPSATRTAAVYLSAVLRREEDEPVADS